MMLWKRSSKKEMSDRILSLIGLCAKAGKIVSGEFACENAIKEGKAFLVLVANDASNNTRKKFQDKSNFYEVPCFVYGDKDSLGHAIGREMRAMVAITDQGLARSIEKQLGQIQI